MNTANINTVIRPEDALWVLFQSQPTNVKQAFLSRLRAENEVEMLQDELIDNTETLSSKELAAAKRIAKAVSAGMASVKSATKKGVRPGRPLEELLAEFE